MASVTLNAYRVEEMHFKNILDTGIQIKLENKYSFNVKYDKENKCVGVFSVEVYDKDNADKFYAKTKVAAFYTFSDGMDKDTIHREAFKEIFPYAKSIITTISANGGIPPIILPTVDIDSQNIYRFDFGNNKK
ncbi:MAG: protein-export chaperone SecB [Clostridia bacterium]|nr:protein-export chaperone SecB [Clostridia bacterium]